MPFSPNKAAATAVAVVLLAALFLPAADVSAARAAPGAATHATTDGAAPAAVATQPSPALPFCAEEPEPPAYYAIELVTTRKVPGTGLAEGTADVTHAASPFSVALAPDGSYTYDVHIQLRKMRPPRRGVLVAWVTTREVDQVRRMGALDENLRARGRVEWNKFLVVVTLEAEDDPEQETWSGPIAFRGMSRSGMMHTMAGHGAFQQENCAQYGYAN